MFIYLTPRHRLVCILLLHHPSQRGKTFAERKARFKAFDELSINPSCDFTVEKQGELVQIKLTDDQNRNAEISPETADMLTKSIAAIGETIADEQALFELEQKLDAHETFERDRDTINPDRSQAV